jgi:transcription antitermination protein NusB
MPIPNLKARKKARQLLMQALYQWQMTGMDLYAIKMQFHTMNDMTNPSKCDTEYFDTLFYNIAKNIVETDAAFSPYLDRELKDLNPIELAVIRLGSHELLHCPEIPCRVVLNEAISLAKNYGSEDGHKYVNGILNKLAHEVRKIELES